ncbi:MAG: hypothetical protein KDC98_01380 [Planctomycetes bacterium]|nr:hypothetical protein [Planctomycetota bacterium]
MTRTTHRTTVAAKALLCMMKTRRHDRAESAHERIAATMAALDTVIVHLPDDPTDDQVAEVDRIVTALRTADECLGNGNTHSGIQLLDLARGRVQRLAEALLPHPGD